jgi:hypothetical protein
VHPDDRLLLPVIDEPLLCRPILLSEFMHAQNPSHVSLLRQELGVQLGGLDGPKGTARAQGIALWGCTVDDIIHGARAVPQRRVASQEAVRGHTGTHKYTLSKVREMCEDCLEAGYHRCLPLQGNALQKAAYQILAVCWQRRAVAQRLGASAAHGYLRVRMAGLCYDTSSVKARPFLVDMPDKTLCAVSEDLYQEKLPSQPLAERLRRKIRLLEACIQEKSPLIPLLGAAPVYVMEEGFTDRRSRCHADQELERRVP